MKQKKRADSDRKIIRLYVRMTMEAEAVHRLLVIAKEADAPVMVVHLTNRKALEEVIAVQERTDRTVYAETCPQYLLLDDSVYSKPDFQGAVYVCAPPIRKKEDQDCLWKALAEEELQTSSYGSV